MVVVAAPERVGTTVEGAVLHQPSNTYFLHVPMHRDGAPIAAHIASLWN